MFKVEDIILNMLLTDHTYYGSFLSQMNRVEDNSIPTLATSFEKGYLTLRYNSEYLSTLSKLQQIAVIEHELYHVIYCYWDRKDTKDNHVWNISHDLSINQMINNLPKEAVLPKHFPNLNLPTNENGEVYYNILIKNSKTFTIDGNRNIFSKGQKIGKICCRKENNLTDSEKEIIKQATIRHSNYGNTPQEIEHLLQKFNTQNSLNWKQILRESIFTCSSTDFKKSWKKFSRKLGEPYKGKVKKRVLKLVICIDTSGSIQTPQFEQFLSELKEIQKIYKNDFMVLEGDTIVQNEYKLRQFTKTDIKLKGGGGTDFRPLLKRCKELRPNIVVFFTDTYGQFPDISPPFKILWVSTNPGEVPFGKVVVIDKGENK